MSGNVGTEGNLSASLPTYASGKARRSEDGESPLSREQYETMSDHELIALVVDRRLEALEALYARYAGAVYSLAVNMLRDGGAAEEVTQDTFFNVWRRASSYNAEKGKVTSWVFSIGHHRVIDEIRRRRRREQTLAFQEIDLSNQPDNGSNDPSKYATLQMQRSEIKGALSTLRPEQRVVVELAYYGGFTHSEIASRLGQPLGTVKTRMRLAIKKLRDVLSPQAREWAEHGL